MNAHFVTAHEPSVPKGLTLCLVQAIFIEVRKVCGCITAIVSKDK